MDFLAFLTSKDYRDKRAVFISAVNFIDAVEDTLKKRHSLIKSTARESRRQIKTRGKRVKNNLPIYSHKTDSYGT